MYHLCREWGSNPGHQVPNKTLYHSFYSDMVECLISDPVGWVLFPVGAKVIGIFSLGYVYILTSITDGFYLVNIVLI